MSATYTLKFTRRTLEGLRKLDDDGAEAVTVDVESVEDPRASFEGTARYAEKLPQDYRELDIRLKTSPTSIAIFRTLVPGATTVICDSHSHCAVRKII
ncbi:hypothetical protein ACO0LO_19925 [Undibacterium sp. TJN25]|uniref:hypothetical protein n=1 Tax=Undibacterium sp. TJN25 TaxID=3413056 RepID=UPI003BF1258E